MEGLTWARADLQSEVQNQIGPDSGGEEAGSGDRQRWAIQLRNVSLKGSRKERKDHVLSHVRPFEPHDCSPPGSSAHGIFQARTPEWVAISFSRESPPQGSKPCLLCLLHWQVAGLGNKLIVGHCICKEPAFPVPRKKVSLVTNFGSIDSHGPPRSGHLALL